MIHRRHHVALWSVRPVRLLQLAWVIFREHGRVTSRERRSLTKEGLLSGQSIAIDATTLEANASMKNIERRDNGQSYDEYLTGLGKAAGMENPTKAELARMDRKRKKKMSNKDWKSPVDGDARIARMKDGSTHLAHKVEHAVDLASGALVAITLQAADQGDTKTIEQTLEEAQEVAKRIHPDGVEEVVADKGYHSGAARLATSRPYFPKVILFCGHLREAVPPRLRPT